MRSVAGAGTPRHSGTEVSTPVARVLHRLIGVQSRAGGWSAKCPAHEDAIASLSVGIGADDRVLLHCFAGCDVRAIVAALDLALRDLFPPPARRTWR